jgi:F420-non-reducing hydrogenase iron-sulfur subunit
MDQLLMTAAPKVVAQIRVIAFVCAKCGRAGGAALMQNGPPEVPAFGWNETVQEVVVACAGRIQPEHLLKPLELGADLVAVVACEEGNCHFLEGSCRARVRCDYVGGLLNEIGLGRERLMLLHLPGSAREDMVAGAPKVKGINVRSPEKVVATVAAIPVQVAQRLAGLPPNPMRKNGEHEAIEVTDVQEEPNED